MRGTVLWVKKHCALGDTAVVWGQMTSHDEMKQYDWLIGCQTAAVWAGHCSLVLSKAASHISVLSEAHHGYTNPIAYSICKFATSQADGAIILPGQPAYESPSVSW